MSENNQTIISAESMKVVDGMRQLITDKHKKVSKIKTPNPTMPTRVEMRKIQ